VVLLQYDCPLECLFNQTSHFVFRRCLRGLQKRGGSFFAHADGQTSACSCFVSVRGLTSHVSGLYTVCLLPLARKGELEVFRPMRGV
jgi:hypothetical protein